MMKPTRRSLRKPKDNDCELQFNWDFSSDDESRDFKKRRSSRVKKRLMIDEQRTHFKWISQRLEMHKTGKLLLNRNEKRFLLEELEKLFPILDVDGKSDVSTLSEKIETLKVKGYKKRKEKKNRTPLISLENTDSELVEIAKSVSDKLSLDDNFLSENKETNSFDLFSDGYTTPPLIKVEQPVHFNNESETDFQLSSNLDISNNGLPNTEKEYHCLNVSDDILMFKNLKRSRYEQPLVASPSLNSVSQFDVGLLTNQNFVSNGDSNANIVEICDSYSEMIIEESSSEKSHNGTNQRMSESDSMELCSLVDNNFESVGKEMDLETEQPMIDKEENDNYMFESHSGDILLGNENNVELCSRSDEVCVQVEGEIYLETEPQVVVQEIRNDHSYSCAGSDGLLSKSGDMRVDNNFVSADKVTDTVQRVEGCIWYHQNIENGFRKTEGTIYGNRGGSYPEHYFENTTSKIQKEVMENLKIVQGCDKRQKLNDGIRYVRLNKTFDANKQSNSIVSEIPFRNKENHEQLFKVKELKTKDVCTNKSLKFNEKPKYKEVSSENNTENSEVYSETLIIINEETPINNTEETVHKQVNAQVNKEVYTNSALTEVQSETFLNNEKLESIDTQLIYTKELVQKINEEAASKEVYLETPIIDNEKSLTKEVHIETIIINEEAENIEVDSETQINHDKELLTYSDIFDEPTSKEVYSETQLNFSANESPKINVEDFFKREETRAQINAFEKICSDFNEQLGDREVAIPDDDLNNFAYLESEIVRSMYSDEETMGNVSVISETQDVKPDLNSSEVSYDFLANHSNANKSMDENERLELIEKINAKIIKIESANVLDESLIDVIGDFYKCVKDAGSKMLECLNNLDGSQRVEVEVNPREEMNPFFFDANTMTLPDTEPEPEQRDVISDEQYEEQMRQIGYSMLQHQESLSGMIVEDSGSDDEVPDWRELFG